MCDGHSITRVQIKFTINSISRLNCWIDSLKTKLVLNLNCSISMNLYFYVHEIPRIQEGL